MAIKEQNTMTFLAGMNQDATLKLQPENSYRFALNALLESEEGNFGSITNERGTIDCGAAPTIGHTIIGATLIDDGRFIIFTTDDTNSTISFFDPKRCTTSVILNAPCLNFKTSNPVQGLFRIFKGCERLVYFTDDLNPYRVINVDDPSQYIQEGGGGIDCDLLSLTRSVCDFPCVDTIEVLDSGGANVRLGTYNFAIRYLDVDGNATNWIVITQTVPIYDENVSGQYHQINGGVNVETGVTGIAGAVNPTNKSIRLSLSNLDTTFSSFQVASLAATSQTGEVDTVLIHPSQSITGATSTFTYTGTNSGTTTAALADITVDNAIISRVKAHAQIDNRLVLGNLSGDTYDWAEVQRQANLITTTYGAINIDPHDSIPNGGAKSDLYYSELRSYMRDEVYAFGIQGRFKRGGGYTPVFHIPGREEILNGDPLIATGNANAHYRNQVPAGQDWDRQLLTVNATTPLPDPTTQVFLDDVRHLGFTAVTDDPFGLGAGLVERWRVYNTAIQRGVILNDPINDNRTFTFGDMAYWESNTAYPDTEDCNGVRIYPTGNIRHHKFPDGVLESAFQFGDPADMETGSIDPIGIRFDLTTFLANIPADLAAAVDCWEIVRVERDDANTTVVDKGIIDHAADDFGATPLTPDTYHLNSVNFNAPKELFLREQPNADFIKVERVLSNSITDTVNTTAFNVNAFVDHISYSRDSVVTLLTLGDIGSTKRNILSTIFLDNAPPLYDPVAVGNAPGFPNITDTHSGVTIQSSFYSIHRLNSVLGADLPLLGDPYGRTDDSRETYYVAYKRNNFNIYSSLDTLSYHTVDNCCDYQTGQILFGGDTFISRFNYREKYSFPQRDPFDTFGIFNLVDMFAESTVNSGLRTVAEPDYKRVYRFEDDFLTYADDVDVFDPAVQENTPQAYQDFLSYNLDYSREGNDKLNFPLSRNFDYCLNCIDDFPYRLWYSEKSFQEQVGDNYRTFLANNYRDLEGQTGELNSLKVHRDELYAFTDRSPWFIPIRPQQISTDENSVFIGTGDVLSIPPKRLVTTEYPYGGSTHPLAILTTEFGIIYPDTQSGKVFMLSKGLDEMSNKGMRNWFENNLPLKLNCQLQEQLNTTATIQYPTHRSGTGLITTYDPRHLRIIMTKKDWEIPAAQLATLSLLSGTSANGDFVYDATTGDFGIATGPDAMTILYPDQDATRFENKSWTISFSLRHDHWASFHSYLPRFMFNDENTFYSTYSTTNPIYKHNEGPYQTYYNLQKADWILEFVENTNPLQTKTLSALRVIGDVSLDNATYNEEQDIPNSFIDRIITYTTDQTTGLKQVISKPPIDPFASVQANYTNQSTILADREDRTWMMSEFYDYTTGIVPTLFSSAWTDTQALFATGLYIDKVINPLVPLVKDYFQLNRLRDKYFGFRFYYNPIQDYKLTIDAVSPVISNSFR